MSDRDKKTAKLKLKHDCTIYEVAQLQQKLLQMLEDSDELIIDISEVKNIDASFLQLLISVQSESKEQKVKYSIVGDSQIVNDLINNMYCQSAIDSDAA